MAKKINFEIEIEEEVYRILKGFLKRVQNVNTIRELFLAYIKQGVSSAVQQIVNEKITIISKMDKPIPVPVKDSEEEAS